MVKNTTGGTGTKGLARKHQTRGDSRLRLPECELELFAIVTKMLGNGMCEIHTNDNIRLIGHIRNKFRGKQKRNNMLSVNNIVLIGLREWENPSKNCDILSIYESNQVDQLRNIPGIQISDLLKRQLGYTNSNATNNDDDLIFTDDVEENIIVVPKQRIPVDFELEQTEEIDIDDI
uniref:S1-like domain-containing protein n=1 Tax=viral metagenome TaxID=1070528 RepID=A0A6C0DBT6_9ZZZZ